MLTSHVLMSLTTLAGAFTGLLLKGKNPVLLSLVNLGYVRVRDVEMDIDGRKRRWQEYGLGKPMAGGAGTQLLLPVPDLLLQAEQKARERRQQAESALLADGFDLDEVPDEEVLSAGPWLKFHRQQRADRLAGAAGEELAHKRQQLLEGVLQYRQEVAEQLGMAPASVMSEALCHHIALQRLCSPDALFDAG